MATPTEEQETTVTFGRNDDVVYIWTSNTVHLRKLRKDARVTEVLGDEDQAHFTVPAESYDIIKGLKTKRTLTPEQRAAAGERLRKARES